MSRLCVVIHLSSSLAVAGDTCNASGVVLAVCWCSLDKQLSYFPEGVTWKILLGHNFLWNVQRFRVRRPRLFKLPRTVGRVSV